MAGGVAKKTAYHHGDLRRQLIDAALAIVEARGAPALTMRELARRLGVTQTAPYHHFADKEAILAEVAAEGFATLDRALREATACCPGSALDRLVASGVAYIRFATAHATRIRVMFGGHVTEFPKYPALLAAAGSAFQALVCTIVAAKEAGELLPGDAHEQALVAWAQVHGLAMLWNDGPIRRAGGGHDDLERLAELAARTVALGLAKR